MVGFFETMLGYRKVGSGGLNVVVLNDWICDTSTWDGVTPYLDDKAFTWAFADVRGYGRSMEHLGEFTAAEVAGDVVELADSLGWKRFAIVGHSMSSLVALHLAQTFEERIERAVLVTPVPPSGFGVDGATLAAMQAMARGDDVRRTGALSMMWGNRLSSPWIQFKVARFRATSAPEAVAGYVAMFARDGVPNPKAKVVAPVLAVTGEQDAEGMRRAAVMSFLSPVCERLVVCPLLECGHYPMQEAPPLFASVVQKFLSDE